MLHEMTLHLGQGRAGGKLKHVNTPVKSLFTRQQHLQQGIRIAQKRFRRYILQAASQR